MRSKRTSPAEPQRAALRVALGLPEIPPGTDLGSDDGNLVQPDDPIEAALHRLDQRLQQLTTTNAALVEVVQTLVARMASEEEPPGLDVDLRPAEPAAPVRVSRVLRATRPRATG
jgi:hypothetical protein